MKIKESDLKKSKGWEFIELRIELEEKLEQLSLFNIFSLENRGNIE